MWDNSTHNNMRKACFKSLAAACLAGLKRFPGGLTGGPAQRAEFREKLTRLVAATPELEVCIKFLDQLEPEKKSA